MEVLRKELDRLRLEVAELSASRRRLVLSADAERRTIERHLHEGVQQHLVALAVNLQLAETLTDTDPARAKELLEEIGHDVQKAVDQAARLAQRIYPPLLEAGGLAAALRSAATTAGIPASIDVEAGSSYPNEVTRTIYMCWLEALDHAGGKTRPTIAVQEDDGALTFELRAGVALSNAGLDQLRDRVEALGGRLTIESKPGRGARVFGSLPLPA